MTETTSLTGGLADPAPEAALAFRAALKALSQPGHILDIEGGTAPAPCSAAAATLILTLCDTTTPLHLAGAHDTAPLRDWVRFHTGAPIAPLEEAEFLLGTWADLQPVDRVRLGDPAYPDRSATLIVELERLEQSGAVLTGPGIKTEARLNLPEIAPFHMNRSRFPLGFDCFFTAGSQVAGLPRSTHVAEET